MSQYCFLIQNSFGNKMKIYMYIYMYSETHFFIEILNGKNVY